MKILIVTRTFPADPKQHVHGVYGRLRTIVRAAALVAREVHILFYTDLAVDVARNEKAWQIELTKYYGAPVSFTVVQPAPRKAQSAYRMLEGIFNWLNYDDYYRMDGDEQRDAFKEIVQGVDLVFVHRLACMPPVLHSGIPLPPVFLDMDDIEHIAFARSIPQPPIWRSKKLLWLHIPALKRAEKKAVRNSKLTFVCSAQDALKLSKIADCSSVIELPNSVSIPEFTAPPLTETFLLLGTYNYQPNVLAAEWMIEEVWPLIRQKLPTATLTIAGMNPENIKQFRESREGIVFFGFAPNLAALYASHRVVVCPILNGGGTRVKLVEAAAHARPAVSTSVGAEGLSFESGKAILIADDSQSFADQCIRLVSEPYLAERMGETAREHAHAHYDSSNIMANLGYLINKHTKLL